jgi:hypothetical protein
VIIKAIKGTTVYLQNNRGMSAKIGARAIVSEDFLGSGWLKVEWDRSDGLASSQCNGGYDASKFTTIALPRQPKFSTAWLDKGELTATGNTFFTQADADNFANAEVEANPGTEMVVVQMVSKHSSSVKVETVAL